jgi:hypothetical protein
VIAKNAISSNKEDNNLPRAANVSTPNKLGNSEKYFNEKVLIFAVSRMQISQKKTSNLPGKMSINHGSAHHGTAPSNGSVLCFMLVKSSYVHFADLLRIIYICHTSTIFDS